MSSYLIVCFQLYFLLPNTQEDLKMMIFWIPYYEIQQILCFIF